MSNLGGKSNVVDDCCCPGIFLAVRVVERLYDGFVNTHSFHSRGCTAGGQSQSGGHDQSEAETCIAQSRSKPDR